MQPITSESTRFHEAGHALLLATCAHPLLRLRAITVMLAGDAAGGCSVEPWWTEREAGWPSWFYPGPDRDVDAMMALFAFGGTAAETVVSGSRPKQGSYIDLVSATLRVAILARVAPSLVKEVATEIDLRAVPKRQQELLLCLKSEIRNTSGVDLFVALNELEVQAVGRVTANEAALRRLAEALKHNPHLPGPLALKLLQDPPLTGVLGPPKITGLLPSP